MSSGILVNLLLADSLGDDVASRGGDVVVEVFVVVLVQRDAVPAACCCQLHLSHFVVMDVSDNNLRWRKNEGRMRANTLSAFVCSLPGSTPIVNVFTPSPSRRCTSSSGS